jgi:hypothetical protein
MELRQPDDLVITAEKLTETPRTIGLRTEQVTAAHCDAGRERALSSGARGRPHNFASAVLRAGQHYCLGRQSLRRISPSCSKAVPTNIRGAGAGSGGT